MDILIQQARELLDYKFELRPFQLECLQNILKKHDTFCVAPTGSRKSIIYEIPNLVFDHLLLGAMDKKNMFSVVIIIQPLKALMEENTNRLKSYGLNAVYLGESNRSLKEEILAFKYNYIFGAPESLTGDGYFADIFKNSAFSDRIKLLVVDESHCIKKW